MSVRLILGLVGSVAVVVIIIAILGLAAGRFLGADTISLADLKMENEQLASALATAQAEVTSLKEVNARLQADLAGGRSVEEERRALQTRSQELDRREQNLVEQEALLQQEMTDAEQRIREKEAKLSQQEREFHDATNLTQQEIGQAKQVLTEYEAMRTSRDEAQELANQWLMFIWIVSIAAFVLLLILVVLIMRFWVVISRSRVEAEQRRQVVTLMTSTLRSSLNQDEKSSLITALNGIAGLPDRSSTTGK